MGKRIMIVDDDEEFLDELKDALSMNGYDCFPVNDAHDALDTAILERPDLIILDLKMPRKSGFQLADELRHLSELGNIPVIAMTAYFKDDYAKLLSICGIEECFKKPFYPIDMVAKIETTLRERM